MQNIPLTIISFLCLTLAACSGNAKVNYDEGMKYIRGVSVTQDEKKGMALLMKAADAGYAPAQLSLGYYYVKGEAGVKQDVVKAVQLFTLAAEQGDKDAQYNVGLAYVRGNGVKADLAKAAEWFMKAAEQGDGGAQYNLGAMYINAEGVEEDPVKALAWFLLAQEQNIDGAAEAVQEIDPKLSADDRHDVEREVARLKDKIKRTQAEAAKKSQVAQ